MKTVAAFDALATLPVIRLAAEMLDSVTPRTEKAFLRAGDGLSQAVDTLGAMRGTFGRLHETLGADRAAALLDGVATTRAGLSEIAVDLDGFLDASMRLRGTVRQVQAHVGALERVVRTIANVSVNARIQAGALSPPRPQVAAFILRLAEMADEAETVLATAKSAMDGIGDDMLAIDDDTKALREAMTRDILPSLSRCAETGHAVHARQAEIAAANAGIAARMAAIRDEVARVVMGLQVGDSTRQRLERVREILAHAQSHADTAVEPVLLPIAMRLTAALVAEADAEILRSVASTEALRDNARMALEQARSAYLGQATADPAIGDGDAAMHQRLGRLAERSLLVTSRIETILKQEKRLRGIAHQVRLSGLNAVLICAKLGEDGRALRELAQWLRALTDESDQISLRLQDALDATRDDLVATGRDRLDRIGLGLARLFDGGRQLRDRIAGLVAAETEAAQRCTEQGRVLGQSLGTALQELQNYRAILSDAGKAAGLVALRAAVLPPAGSAFAEGSPERRLLDAIRATYTMQTERDLHDALVPPPDGAAPAAPQAPPAPAAAQDMDDIFF